MKQKALQQDIASELESLTFNELGQIAMLINEFYSKVERKAHNCDKYVRLYKIKGSKNPF
jgi:hypothetical protein